MRKGNYLLWVIFDSSTYEFWSVRRRAEDLSGALWGNSEICRCLPVRDLSIPTSRANWPNPLPHRKSETCATTTSHADGLVKLRQSLLCLC